MAGRTISTNDRRTRPPPVPKGYDPAFGAKRFERQDLDVYDTIDPRLAVALVTALPEMRAWPIWEAAAGAGQLSDRLAALGCQVVHETDLEPRHERVSPLDFLAVDQAPPHVGAIVTNPPFDILDDIARQALRLMQPNGGKVVLLARLEWMTGLNRADLTSHPAFDAVMIPRFRPLWFSRAESTSPRFNFVWVVWDWSRRPGPAATLFVEA